MKILLNTCKKHGELNEETGFKEPYKDGARLRCKICRGDAQAIRSINKGTFRCNRHGWLNSEDIKIKKDNRRNASYLSCRICHRASASTARDLDRTKANEWGRRDRALYPEKYKKWREERIKRIGLENWKQQRIDEYNKRVYKLTAERYREMLKEQDYKCKICRKHETRKSSKSDETLRLCIDHCHKTGIVRGLLCHDCNTSLGKFKESTELFCRAIEYLEKFEKDDDATEIGTNINESTIKHYRFIYI